MFAELLRGAEFARGEDGVGQLLVWLRGRGANLAGGGLDVLLLDGPNDVGGRQLQVGQLVRLQPDAHAVFGAAGKVHLGNAL